MKITKAILLTVLLTAIFYIPPLGLVGLYKFTDLIGEGIKFHYYSTIVLSSLISYIIVFYFYWKPRPNLKVDFDIKRFDILLVPYLLLIAIGLGFAEQPLFDFNKIVDFYSTSEATIYSYRFEGVTTTFFYQLISTLLLAPVLEELFFRRFLFTKLLEKNNIWTSIIVSSSCFAIIHFLTPINIIPTFIFGIIACIIYLKTRNIIYLILVHFLNNLFSTLYSIHGQLFFEWIYALNYDLVYWSLSLFGIFLTVLGVKKITSANRS